MKVKSNNEKNSLVLNAVFNVVYRMLNILFPLITAGYVARVLTPAGVGLNFTVQNNVSYFVIFAMLGIPAYAIREIAKIRDDRQKTDKLFSELLVLNAILTTLSLLLFFVCVFTIDYLHKELVLYLICGITILTNYINFDWYYQAVEEYRFIAVRSIIIKVISMTAVFIFVREPDDLYIYAFIYSMANCGQYLINIIRARRNVSLRLRELELWSHIKPLVYLTLYVISIEIYSHVDITMLGIIDGQTTVAFYSCAQRVISLVVTFIISVTAVFLPRLSYYYANERDKFYRLTKFGVDLMIFISVPACIGIASIAGPLIRIWLGSEYEESIPCLIILSFIIPLKCIGDMACFQVMICAGKEMSLMVSNFAALFVNIVLNVLLIPRYGAFGASVASLISEVFVFILVLYLSRKLQLYKADYRNLFSVMISSAVMSVTVLIIESVVSPVLLAFIMGMAAGVLIFVVMNLIMSNSFFSVLLINRIRGMLIKYEKDKELS